MSWKFECFSLLTNMKTEKLQIWEKLETEGASLVEDPENNDEELEVLRRKISTEILLYNKLICALEEVKQS